MKESYNIINKIGSKKGNTIQQYNAIVFKLYELK